MTLAGRSVVVTGADGFIGSHLVERLIADGAHVRAMCLYNSFGKLGWLDSLDEQQLDLVDVQLGDIRDPESVERAFDSVEIAFHLAALIAIPYSYESPRSFIDTNVLGTYNVLQSASRHGVERLVHTSTSEVYGTPDVVPITEAHPLKAQSPYSASKIAADKLCEAWACSFSTPVVVLRPFNTYGPRQSARAVIPAMLAQLLTGERELRLGSLSPRRDFTFVSDTVDGFIRAADQPLAPGQVVHLGTGTAVSIGDVLQRACALLGTDVDVVQDEERMRPPNSEVEVLLSDPGLARELLGWSATVTLDEGLQRTIEWLRPRVDARAAARFQR